jgi:hypothetical protein
LLLLLLLFPLSLSSSPMFSYYPIYISSIPLISLTHRPVILARL